MTDVADLTRWFGRTRRAILGYSGGVDSAVLAVVGTQALGADEFLAVIGRSASYPEAQWRVARGIADRFGVPVLEIDTEELDDPNYRANAPDRCYHCKSELWRRLGAVAEQRGFAQILDGGHLDDQGEHRPGARAGAERGVRSPLAELGWGKARVREVARTLGLPTWDAPAAPCLSSRLAYGLEVTPFRLRQVELGESFLRSLGVRGDLRVRHHGPRARIEAAPEMHGLLERHCTVIARRFAELGFEAVDVNPAGYRRGSLLPVVS